MQITNIKFGWNVNIIFSTCLVFFSLFFQPAEEKQIIKICKHITVGLG